MQEQSKTRGYIPSLVMAVCLFIGIGCGLYYGNVTAGILIGLGTGIILMVILRFILTTKANAKRNQK